MQLLERSLSRSFSRAAEQQLVGSAAVDSLLDALPVGVLMVDRDGRPVYMNAAARALRIEQLEPLHWAVTRALLTEDVVREDEIEVVGPDDTRRWLGAHVIPVRKPGHGVSAALVTLVDVTSQARMATWNPIIETLANL